MKDRFASSKLLAFALILIPAALPSTIFANSLPIAPNVQITSPQNGATVLGQSLLVEGTVDDATVDSIDVNEVRVPVQNGAFQATISLIEGENTISATAQNGLGESGSANITVIGNASETVQWRPVEFNFVDEGNYSNPWLDASVTGVFTGPSGENYEVPGYWDGGDNWKLRFTPTAPGLWTFNISGSDNGLSAFGEFTAEPSVAEHGFIRVGAANPYILEHDDGTPFFWMATTNYGIMDVEQSDYEAAISAHKSQNFNNMRIEVEWEFNENIPYEGTSTAPDRDRINPAYFAKLDSIFEFGLAQGMTFELILFNYYDAAGLFHVPPMTDEQQENFLRYLVARYTAYPNLALWTIANEYETYPDGKYLVQGTDVDWSKARATFIRSIDPYRHLIGTHPFAGYSLEGQPIVPGGTAGDLYGDYPDIDVLIQQHYGANSGPDFLPRFGDAAGLEEGVAYDRIHNKPVLNLEYGYAHFDGRNNNPPNNQQFDADYLRRGAWRLVVSGAFLATGFDGTSMIKSAEVEVNSSETETSQYSFLYEFFTQRVNWPNLAPDNSFIVSGDALGSASPADEQFVVYLPNGGGVELLIDGGPGELLPRWINPATFEEYAEEKITYGQPRTFNSPLGEGPDMALLLSTEGLNDATPPFVFGVQEDIVSQRTATITWSTDEAATSQIEWGADETYGNFSDLDTELRTAHTHQITGLSPQSTYHYRVVSRDANGNESKGSNRSFTTLPPDMTAPIISGVSVNSIASTTAIIVWNTDEPSDSQIEYGLDANYGNSTVLDTNPVLAHSQTLTSLLPATLYHFRVISKDEDGNQSQSEDFTFTTLESPHYTQRVNVGAGSFAGGDGRIWDADKSYFEGSWGYDGGGTQTGSTSDEILQTEDDALYQNYRFRVKDYRFTVPGSGTYSVELHFAETHYKDDGLRVFDVSLEGSTVLDDLDIHAEVGHDAPYVRNFDVEVTDGVLDVTFRNVIENALVSAIEVKLRVGDNNAPTISNIVAAPTSSDRATITWDTDQKADSQIEYGLDQNYGSTTALDNTLVFMHSQELENLQPETTYHFRVLSRDGAGNLAVSGDMTFTTFPLDQIPPEISNIRLNDITETSVNVTWDTDENADSQVEYGLDLSYGTFSELDPALVLNHDQTITGLEPNTTYHLRVLSKDLNGNQSVSADCVFATLPDLVPPTISDVTVTEVFEDSVTIPWTTDELADSQIEYGLDANYGNFTPVDPDLVTTHFDGIGGLQPSTTYHFRAVSTDRFGNRAVSEDFTFTTTDPDLTPPTISDVQTSNVFPDSVTIVWNTDEAADTYVEFGLDANYGSVVGKDESVNQHEQGLGGLLPETTYHFRVLSTDLRGNQAASDDFTFTTRPEDQTPPAFSNVTAKNIAMNSATISWNTDEPGDSQVEYGLDTNYGSFTTLDPALTLAHNQELTGLQENTIYHYRVWSTDELGNRGPSEDFVFRTAAVGGPSYLQRVNVGGGDYTAPDGTVWAADRASAGNDWGYDGSRSGVGDTNDPIANTDADALYQTNRYRIDGYRFTVENGTYFVQLHFCEEYYTESGKRKFDVDIEGQQVINDLDVIAEAGHDAALVFEFETEVTDGRLDVDFRKVLENAILSGIEVRSEADGVAPEISNVNVSNIGETGATVSWNTNEPADSQVEFGLDANYGNITTLDISLVTAHNVQLSNLQPGTTYHYRTLSRDESGNLSMSADFTFTTDAPDLTPPTFSNVAVAEVYLDSVKITWNTNELSDSQVEFGLDASYGNFSALDPSMTTTHTVGFGGLASNTTYHFRALSRDASGNLGQSTDFTFTTLAPDETPPVLSDVVVTEVFTDSVTVTWNTDEAADDQIEFGLDENYGGFSALNPALLTAHQNGVGGLEPNTTYHFRARSKDASGNLGLSADFTFTTLERDETPPVISNVVSSNITSTGASISWNTDEAADSQVEFGVSTAYGNLTAHDPNLVTAHNQQLSDLSPNTTYHFRVLSSDSSGNQAISDDFTFTTPAPPQPSYEQRVNVGGGSYTDGDGQIWDADKKWSAGTYGYVGSRSGSGDTNDPIANTDDDVLYQTNRYRLDSYRFDVEPGDYIVTLHFCEEYHTEAGKRRFHVDLEGQNVIDDLDVIAEAGHDAALVYTFEVTVTGDVLDVEFRKIVENAIISAIEVRSAADTAPPQISNVAATEVGAETATIIWSTDEPADSQVEFGLDANYGSISPLDPALVTSHSVELTGLTPGATYHYRALSKDESGNLALSSGFTFTTIIPDLTPPDISDVVVTEIFPDSVTVTWNTDEVADSQIEFGPDATYGGMTTLDPAFVQNHAHGVGGLSSGTTYHFRVLSKDTSGNLATSEDLTFTTQEIDATPPVISNVQAGGLTQSSAMISWNTDEAADSQVEYGLDTNYGSTTALDPTLITEHNLQLSNLQPSTTYHYRVHSRDASGNLATSDDFLFTTASDGNVAYANVQGIYDRNCVRCHSGPSPPADLDLSAEVSFAQTVNVASTQEPTYLLVKPFDHVMSWLHEKIVNPNPSVGSKMANLTDDEIDLIAKWIDQGAVQTPVAPFRALEFRTTGLSDGEINIVYSQQIVVWGGLPDYNFEIASGALPDGLVLGTDGALTGAPTAIGGFNFTVRVSDSQNPAATLEQAYTLTIRDTQNSWSVPENFEIVPVVTDLHLPLNIAFIPNPGPNESDPYFYVTLQQGEVVMVQRNYETTTYAGGLLNFDPGETEAGLRGVVVDPNNGDVLVSLDYEDGGAIFSKITRLKSTDGGRTSSSQEDVLTGIPADYSHQIQALTIGADGLLYANVGDGQQPASAPDPNDLRGKILRLNLDGSKPGDNPFPDSYVYATGMRNPFGGAWRAADGKLYVSDNGPDTGDRLVKIEAGQDHGWRLIDPDLTTGAIQYWDEVVVPGAVDFNENTPFDPQFPGWLFAALVADPFITGPDSSGKKIQAFELDASGAVVNQTEFLNYTGAGVATVLGLAFGPDALYFTDLYGENGFDEFGKTHANVYRVRWLSDDATPPVISNIQVTNISDESATITWQTDEPAQRQIEFGADENYGSWTALETDLTTQHSVILTGLSPATTYHFRVWNWDSANNGASSADQTFTTATPDETPPVISNVQANEISATGATIVWNTDEAADSQIEYGPDTNYGNVTILDPNLVTSHSQALAGLTANTTYHYRVLSRDAAGNLATSDDFTFTTSAPPGFARRVNVGGGEYTGVDGRIWSADQKDDGEFGYDGSRSGTGDTNHAIADTEDDALYQTNRYRINAYRFAVPSAGEYMVELHFCEEYHEEAGKRIFDVSIEGTRVLDDLDIIAEVGHDVALVYTFEAEVTDGVLDVTFQNVLENAMISGIEVKSAGPDLVPPVISNVASSNVTQTSATISWNTDEASDSQVEYGTNTSYGSTTAVDPAQVTAHNVQLDNLEHSTTYHFRVKSRDASGNLATSGDFTFTTPAPDATPPVISNVAAQNIASSSASIVWNTDEASDSQVEYGLDTNYGDATTLDPALETEHGVQLSNLEPSTTYHFRVLSRDASGNLATSDDFTFTTLEEASWVQRVNVADGQYTGVDGRDWDADQEYQVGSWGYKGSRSGTAETSDPVANTEDDVLYQFNRYRFDHYRFTVPQSGTYSVQLLFAETYYQESGKRKFDVDLEGQQVLNDLDVHAVAGHDAALVYNFDVSVTDGVLDIDFNNVLENPIINAIEVKLKPEGASGKRVLLVGNSITDGVGSSDGLGFRPELYNMLHSAGESVDFVGPEGASPYEGHFYPGQNLEDFYPQSFGNGSGTGVNDLAETLDLYQPSVVMIHLGANDLTAETNLSPYSNNGGQTMAHSTAGNVGELVNYVLQWRDGTEGNFVEHIFVSQIVPRGDRENETVELNDEIIRLIDDFAAGAITGQSEPVHMVDHYTPFDNNPDLFTGNGNDYMAEDLHPNDRGYDVMAETYFDAYAAVIGVESAAILAAKDGRRRTKDVIDVLAPQEFKLSQNYPNPFSARAQQTWIKFQLAKDAAMVLEVYDILGRRVRTLVNETKPAGFYQTAWNGRNESGLPVSSGIYYYVLRSENFVKSLRMTVVK